MRFSTPSMPRGFLRRCSAGGKICHVSPLHATIGSREIRWQTSTFTYQHKQDGQSITSVSSSEATPSQPVIEPPGSGFGNGFEWDDLCRAGVAWPSRVAIGCSCSLSILEDTWRHFPMLFEFPDLPIHASATREKRHLCSVLGKRIALVRSWSSHPSLQSRNGDRICQCIAAFLPSSISSALSLAVLILVFTIETGWYSIAFTIETLLLDKLRTRKYFKQSQIESPEPLPKAPCSQVRKVVLLPPSQ